MYDVLVLFQRPSGSGAEKKIDKVYSHWTNAADTSNINTVFNDVCQSIITEKLEQQYY